ncbi:MAG TPA: hypothetical protein VFS50_17280 [Meiothermus sp.]|jgi:beta-phosphoglucomutase-like phosphatase (HAD superfamily)|nr:hypothetical protein [Meiothermus sp.]
MITTLLCDLDGTLLDTEPGILEALRTLFERYRMVVATSKHRVFQQMVEHFGFSRYFSAIYG